MSEDEMLKIYYSANYADFGLPKYKDAPPDLLYSVKNTCGFSLYKAGYRASELKSSVLTSLNKLLPK